MHIKPWSKLPTLWITDGRIRDFTWKTDGAAGTAVAARAGTAVASAAATARHVTMITVR